MLFLLGLFICSPPVLSAILPDFMLAVSQTDETCLGNGTLSFSVSGVEPGATLEYKIFQLPDTTNPIAVQTANFLGGRGAGTYRIVATQTFNGQSNSQTKEATISNAIVPLGYTITSTNSLCGSDGSMTITVTSGIAVQYEIISGPVIRPLQNANVFNMIPAGVYEVRVFNNCGDGTVVTHTLISDAPAINIGGQSFGNVLPACDRIIVKHTLTTSGGSTLSYPVVVQIAVFSPNGSNAGVLLFTFPNGSSDQLQVDAEIPFFYDQSYHYDLTVTDGCGNVYSDFNPVNKKLEVLLSPQNAECGDYFLSIKPTAYMPPFNITFTAFPADFDPETFNSDHPGPFAADNVPYGEFTIPVPYGHYAISITDACGRTATDDVTLIDEPNEPEALIQPLPGCQANFSLVKISINGIDLDAAIITSAPAAYAIGHPLPDDVTEFITIQDGLVLQAIPEGHYIVLLIDVCGNEYIYEFDVPGLATSPVATTRADCEAGKGAIRIRVNSAILLSVIVTAAPPGFTAPLPYDASTNITPNGVFSMNNLPVGSYTFDVENSCGLTNSVTQSVSAYTIFSNDFNVIPHCGSFDINLAHVSNGDVGLGFWLQRFDAIADAWEHPVTGVDYIDGTVPDAGNSLSVTNNGTTFNLAFLGTFRIIKRFETFENGNVGQFKSCLEIIKEFVFDGSFDITFQKVTCGGTLANLKVIANGVPPFTYKITHKNGNPFSIDNGANNIFTNLETAVYSFEVEESCGNIAVGDADVAQLPSAAHAIQPNDMTSCADSAGNDRAYFMLSNQNALILGAQAAPDFTISYHVSEADATAGNNPVANNYLSESCTIYARLKYNANPDCFDVTSFDLIVKTYPVLLMEKTWGICPNGNTTIIADAGFDSYLWSTGETTPSIVVSQAGSYTLEVTKNGCSATSDINVIASPPPVILSIKTSDWTDNQNSITVILSGSSTGNYIYSLDGVHFQVSNVFDNLLPGAYKIFVKEVFGCNIVTEDTYLLNYIKYFTPNGDGFHEYWRVIFAEAEPHLITYVFDRYGKLITGFGVDSLGWDGTLNGEKLPSTDYWFLVVREDGKELRGHFTMKR